MKIQVKTHAGLILIDPNIEIHSTLDDPNAETFTPSIILVDSVNPEIRIGHVLPPQPYVNGTWTDKDVEQTIAKYIDEIKID